MNYCKFKTLYQSEIIRDYSSIIYKKSSQISEMWSGIINAFYNIYILWYTV